MNCDDNVEKPEIEASRVERHDDIRDGFVSKNHYFGATSAAPAILRTGSATAWSRARDRTLGRNLNVVVRSELADLRRKAGLYGRNFGHAIDHFGGRCDSTNQSWWSMPRETSVNRSAVSASPKAAASSIADRAD